MPPIDLFDATQYDPDRIGPGGPLPPGVYKMIIVATEFVESRRGHTMLKVEFRAIDPPGGKVWANLNLNHPDETVRGYAHNELAAICRACGKQRISNTEDLHNIPIYVELAVEDRKDDPSKKSNVIVAYRKDGASVVQSNQVTPNNAWSRPPV